MNGLLSSSPGSDAIRLMIGSQLLLLIEVALVLQSPAPLGPILTGQVMAIAIVGVVALVAAVIGEPSASVHVNCREDLHRDR